MDEDEARKLSAAREHLGVAFSEAIAETNSMPTGAERSRLLRGLATLLIGQSAEFRANAVSQCPELEVTEPIPDSFLEPEERELVSRLTPPDLKIIDEALLHSSVFSWRKVPRVIGGAMVVLDGRLRGLPIGLYVQRIEALVEGGELLARGNIAFMRLSEVRLPAVHAGVA